MCVSVCVCVGVCVCVVCVCVCARVCTVLVRGLRRVTPLFSFSMSLPVGGRRGCRGAPSNEALPYTPGERTCLVCAWAPSWAAGGPSSSLSPSSHVVPCDSVVSHTARAGPIPFRIISSLFCFVRHSFGLAYLAPKSHLIFVFIIIIIILCHCQP